MNLLDSRKEKEQSIYIYLYLFTSIYLMGLKWISLAVADAFPWKKLLRDININPLNLNEKYLEYIFFGSNMKSHRKINI